MDETLKPTKTVYTVGQYVEWQRQKTLDLNPIFQRRPVWKAPAKSQLIDSIARGYPLPIIILRQVQDLDSLSTRMEVVDGQQRLRTLLAFIDPTSLADFDADRDSFMVLPTHNSDIAEKPFSRLPVEIRQAILAHELSTHIFPATTGDELVFRIFARLNSTGLRLTPQELRNSEFHGAFKTLVYELSFANLDAWRRWRVFSNDAISRMDEAEGVSEYILAMTIGITAKSQPKISEFYEQYEDDYPASIIVRQRFEAVIGALESSIGGLIPGSPFQRATLFYSLFAAVYHHMYGLGSPFKRVRPKALPRAMTADFRKVSARIRSKDLPEKVQDAMDKATGDKARRDQRHRYLMRALNLDSAI